MKLDTMLPGPLSAAPAAARHCADMGFDGVFTFEGPTDVFFPLVLAARAAPLDLMTNVAIAFPRSPIHLAHAANDLHVLSEGRFRLGLGSQVRAQVERRYGAEFAHPVARMREWVDAIRAVFAAWESGDRLDFRGRFTTHTLMTPMFTPGPNPFGRPPILLGALGPAMTRMAAEVADGLLVMPFNSHRFVHDHTLPAVADGLAAAGRSSDDLEMVCEVIVCAGRTEPELAVAEAGVRGLLSFYGSTPAYRVVLEAEGWGDLQPELNALSKQGQWGAMAERIDPTMLRTLAVHGTPKQCAAQIVERFGAMADRVAFYLPYAADDGCVAEIVDALKA